jgi:RNA polymerase sigma-70 factor (ECF subfamily)
VSESLDGRFARLMTAFGPALARVAAGYEADPAERDDLLQEIAIALWRALPRFRGECSERTFVYRVAHNRGLTHRARRRRRHPPLDLAPEPVDPHPDPEASVAASQRHERLAGAVRQLDAALRVVVLLTLEGLSNREVAEVVGITENNVAVRLTRARGKLRELLAGSIP